MKEGFDRLNEAVNVRAQEEPPVRDSMEDLLRYGDDVIRRAGSY